VDFGYDDTIGISFNLFRIGDRNIHPKTHNHDKLFWTNNILNNVHTPISWFTKINTENPSQLPPSPFPVVLQQLALASNFVANPLLYHISDFKKIISGLFAIRPQIFEWFPIWILRVMDLATGSVGVTVIITADFDFFEFLLQELNVTFEEFLETRLYF
jgi:hypothetical protein